MFFIKLHLHLDQFLTFKTKQTKQSNVWLLECSFFSRLLTGEKEQ